MVFEKIAAAPVAGAASSNSKVFASSATARVARRSSVVEGASGAGAPAKKFWTEAVSYTHLTLPTILLV